MKQLTPADLAQFRMRRSAVEQAGYAFAMIQAGYTEWSKQIKQRYKLRGEFDVDWERGLIQMRDKPNGGRKPRRKTRRRKK